MVWGFFVGYSFQREKRRCGRYCCEAVEGFGAVADGVNIVQDRFGPEVVPALSENMVVAMCMASLRIFCRSVAMESMESLSANIGPVGSAVLDGLGESPRLVSIALAIAIASEVGKWESIAT